MQVVNKISAPMFLLISHLLGSGRGAASGTARIQGFELIPKVVTGVLFVEGQEQTQQAA